MNKGFGLVLVALLAAMLLGAWAIQAQPAAAPRLAQGSAQSLNWAGYAVAVGSGSVDAAYGSWIVPALVCTKQTTYAAFWVGIDGYNDSTVEQTGILGECVRGGAVYYAWYEFYPASPVYAPSSDVVAPGDKVLGSVVYNPSANCYTTTLKDVSQGWTYTSPCTTVSGALRSDAEWIVERPAVGGSLTKLANFGTANFGQDYTGLSGTSIVTIKGVNHTIAGSPNYVSITMVNSNGAILASPSALTADGTSFYVTYE